MGTSTRPTVWEMVKAAIRDLHGSTTNIAVRRWVQNKYPGTNRSTINCQMIAGCVNHPSRVHYAIDARPRPANNTELDRYFRPERGRIEEYDPKRHGQWEICESTEGKLSVRQSPNNWQAATASHLVAPLVLPAPKLRHSRAEITTQTGEVAWVLMLQPRLEEALQSLSRPELKVRIDTGHRLPYAAEILSYQDQRGVTERLKLARYQTDLLVYDELTNADCWIPRVVIECKIKGVTTHDALTYSAKAATHKHVHPYLRYGMLIGSYGTVLPARLVRHGAYFGFMAVWNDAEPTATECDDFISVLRSEVEASRTLQRLLTERPKSRQAFRMLHRPLVFKA